MLVVVACDNVKKNENSDNAKTEEANKDKAEPAKFTDSISNQSGNTNH